MATETDSYVQVAPDSTGKKVDMSQVATSAGDVILRQRAELVGDPAAAILEMNETLKKVLAVQRGILFALTSGDVDEEAFLD
jgi:hypothetical protein